MGPVETAAWRNGGPVAGRPVGAPDGGGHNRKRITFLLDPTKEKLLKSVVIVQNFRRLWRRICVYRGSSMARQDYYIENNNTCIRITITNNIIWELP